MGGLKTLAVAAVATASLLLLTGCGQRSEPKGPSVDVYPVTVEQASGPPVVLDHRPSRVVALTPQAASLVSSVLERKISPGTKRESGELVVTTPEALASRPAGSYAAPDASIDDVERSLTELGLLLDRPLRARDLVDRIEAQRRLVRQHVGRLRPVTVFVDTGLFTTVSRDSLLGDLIEEAGGSNVAGPGPQTGPFGLGRLARSNPDFYLATSDSGTTLADLRRDPRTRRLKAVRTGHFALLAAKVLEPGGEIGTELVAIARYLHPDAFR